MKLKRPFFIVPAAALVLALALFFLPVIRGAQPVIVGENETDQGVRLPILMYHSILKTESRQGKYVLSPDVLEADMKYLSEHGYKTVTVSDLIAYVDNGTPLPEKPVMLTFDDGFYNNVVYVLPLLENYDMKAVISPVGAYADEFAVSNDMNVSYAYVTWEVIKQAGESGRIEIQNHSYNLHSTSGRQGANKKKGEDFMSYKSFLTEDTGKMQRMLTEFSGVTPTAYTYPFGALCQESEDILKEMGFRATFSCYERINYITRDPSCLFCLGRYNRPAGISTERFMKGIAY